MPTPTTFLVRRPFALAPGWFSYRQADGSWGADYLTAKHYPTQDEAQARCNAQNEGAALSVVDALTQERRRIQAHLHSLECKDSALSISERAERSALEAKSDAIDEIIGKPGPQSWKDPIAAKYFGKPPVSFALTMPGTRPYGMTDEEWAAAKLLPEHQPGYRSDAERARCEGVGAPCDDQPSMN